MLGSLDLKFSGRDTGSYAHKSGIIDRATCRDVVIPTGHTLVAYKGYYAKTKCCPLVAGFKLKFDTGATVSVGYTPRKPIVAASSSSHKAAKAAPWVYHSTAWIKAGGDLMGYGGASGGAWDSMFLVFNSCGPKYQLASMRKLLAAKNAAVVALTKIVG